MTNKKPQLTRDIILISILLLIVLVVFVLYYALKEEGDLAIVSYDNEVLFEVNLANGELMALTSVFEAMEMPVIKNDNLIVDGQIYTGLDEGKGVVVYKSQLEQKDYYFVEGNLGYVKMYYSYTTNKMRVTEETSPYNTCSKQGESNDVPIVCLPNYVTIKFTSNEADDII